MNLQGSISTSIIRRSNGHNLISLWPLAALALHLSSPLPVHLHILITSNGSLFSTSSSCLWNQLPYSFLQHQLGLFSDSSVPAHVTSSFPSIHHSHPPSHPRSFTPRLKLTCFTNPSHHRLPISGTPQPTRTRIGHSMLISFLFLLLFVIIVKNLTV